MRLYTEEQIKQMLDFFQVRDEDIVQFIEKMIPIELPSDEEIESNAKDKVNLSADCFGQYDFTSGKQDGFIDGAIWMRDKIQGGNK